MPAYEQSYERKEKKMTRERNSVHSALPDWMKTTTTLSFRKLVWRKLKWGKRNALKGRVVTKLCGEKEDKDNTKVRKAMKEIFYVNKKPVVSCSKGYFKAETEEEIRECKDKMFEPHLRAALRNIETCDFLIEKIRKRKRRKKCEL
jgi:hypothetical protein